MDKIIQSQKEKRNDTNSLPYLNVTVSNIVLFSASLLKNAAYIDAQWYASHYC